MKQNVLIVLALIPLCLPAIQPFTLGEMPETADGMLQLQRVVVANHSLHVDHPLWARYSSGLAFGYGAPLFNYFPPTSYYLPGWLHTFGMTFQQAWLWSMALYTMMGAGGAFLLGRVWSNVSGGFVTAVAYVYAPYWLFDTVSRGALAEVGALALLPFVLWGFTRLAWHGRRRDFVLAVWMYALFIIMHTIMTLHGTLLLTGYCVLLLWMSQKRSVVFGQSVIAGSLSLLMTAFFWLPALTETDAIQITAITENLSHIDVTQHLRPLSEVLALPFTADTSQQAQPIPITLHWIQLVVSGVGLMIAIWKKLPFRSAFVFGWIMLLIVMFLNAVGSAWVWETVPLIGYTQFAWRVLGIGSLVLSWMTGLSVALILPSQLRIRHIAVLSGFVVILMVYALPWVYTLYLPQFTLNGIVDVQDFERETGQVTASSYSEYLPVWNQVELDPTRLQDRFAEGDVIPRLLESETVQIESAEWFGTSANLTIHVTEESSLIFDWLYVNGWQARLDGEVVLVYPKSPEGLVAVDTLEGTYVLNIWLASTETQSLSHMLSLVGIIGFVVVWALRSWFVAVDSENGISDEENHSALLVGMLLVGIGVFLTKALIVDQTQNPIRRDSLAEGVIAGVTQPLQVNFDNQIALLGVDLPAVAKSDSVLSLSLYWQATDQLETDYSSVFHLRDMAGNIIAEGGSFTPGNLATTHWREDFYVAEELDFEVPQGIPPGTYTLDVGLFDAVTQTRLNVINALGNPVDVKVKLGTIEIARPDNMPSYAVNALRVELVNPLPEQAIVGDELTIIWRWQIGNAVDEDLRARLIWLNDEAVSAMTPLVEATLGYVTSEWDTGDTWLGHHRLYVPADLEAGVYDVGIQIADDSGNVVGNIQDIHMMRVSTPERHYELPKPKFEVNLVWEDGIRMLGYDIEESADVVSTITLYWQTDDMISESLRLFVHALNADEQILAVSDGVPVDWTRPTTSWATGEVIVTKHRFEVGSMEGFRVGWYNPLTEVRVQLDESDSLLIELP